MNTVLIQRLNRTLCDACQRNGFTYAYNGAVLENYLWIDGIQLQESGKRIAENDLLQSFFRICEPTQVVSMKENLLFSDPESVRQNTLDSNNEVHSERHLIYQFEKKSINTTPNSLTKIKELRVGNVNEM